MRWKLKILCFFLALFSFGVIEAQQEKKIEWDYSGMAFSDFAAKAESHDTLRFFYMDEWVSDLKLGVFKGAVSLSELLDDLFRGKSLYYYIDNAGNVIVTRNFAIKVAGMEASPGLNFIPSVSSMEQENQQSSASAFIAIGNPADRNKPGNVILTGYITSRDTREPVPGVTIFNQKLSSGTISNQYGFYSLSMPRGSHQLQFTFVGMKEKSVNINLYGQGEMNIEMNSTLIPLKETVVSADRNMVLKRYEVGAEKINITSFRLLPTSMGESDIIKSVLLLPGVQTVGEGSAGFNVRGGSADQNLIIMDGSPFYNTSHFFGFFSAVNSDIIKDVTLYKGGIPSRFGGRISSILDIGTRDGSMKEFKGNAGISPITTHFVVEGPLKKDTSSFIITGRTTYSNWIFKLIDNPALQRSRASFYDVNAKFTYDINKNNRLDFSSYLSHDSFRFNSDTTYSYDNSIVNARWRHFFNSRFLSLMTLNNSNYRYDISGESGTAEAFILSHRINSTGLKGDFNYFLGRNEINFGTDLTWYDVIPGSYKPANDSSLVKPVSLAKERALEAALYIDDKFVLNEYVSLNAGIRFSSFFVFGPETLLLYDPGFTRSRSSVIDTLSYKASHLTKLYGGPELRFSINFKLTNSSSLKINYNRTRQYLHLLSNSTSISPTDTWKLCDYYLKPQIGDQYAIGFYQMLYGKSVEASAEIYYKSINNMVDYKGGTSLIMNENIEQDLVGVKGKAYGLELMIKKSEGRVRWSLGYTFARTFLKSTGKFDDEILNKGKWFPANFDRPNDLVFTFNYLFSRRFSLSANYTYSTGRPVTYPVSSYYLNDIYIIYYSDRNKYRIPDYSRLDLSFRFSGNLKSHKIANPNWTFSVFNLLGRQNVYSEYFNNINNQVVGYKLSVFGEAIPSVTLSFDF
jgi:Outer membrane receptor proteins, mostly Fe transport